MNKVSVFLITVIIIVTSLLSVYSASEKDSLISDAYKNEEDIPSSWAIEGLKILKNEIDLDESVYCKYRKNISRKEFSYLAVKLYQVLSGQNLDISVLESNVFKDCNDNYVNAASSLGIIKGYGDGMFGPYDPVTREQIAVMLIKTIEKSGYLLSRIGINDLNFEDNIKISSWALESVRLSYNNQILNGVAAMTIEPESFTTKEQALILIHKVIERKAKLNLVKELLSYNLTLKWDKGGAYNSWSETGWYSRPAYSDVNGDGKKELVGSAYSIVCLNPLDGTLIWRAPSGHQVGDEKKSVGRTWPNIIIKDIDNDGSQEIITAHGSGYVSVLDGKGKFKTGWPKRLCNSELRGLQVEDVDLDSTYEIIVSAAEGSKTNTWVYEHNGTLREGWPQLSGDSGYAWGVFNNNASIGNITGDARLEIVVPSDVHYICAYNDAGKPLKANNMYGNKFWGQVGVWEDLNVEIRGWGKCTGPRSEKYRPNFASGGSVIADVDNNGANEVVVVGNVYDCEGTYTSKYMGPFIFNGDRSRFKNAKYNWENTPVDSGEPLEENYSVIENIQPNPVVEDVEGDGEKEIVYSSYDGKIHCYWLDKQEKFNWPYEVYNPTSKYYEFSSVPAVVDLNEDGYKEIVLTTWTSKNSGQNGKVIIIDYQGNLLASASLPNSFNNSQGNGALASPLVEDIDGDGLYEIVVNTVNSGFVVYDIFS